MTALLATWLDHECYVEPVQCNAQCSVGRSVGSGPCVPVPSGGGGGEEDCEPQECPDGETWDFDTCRCVPFNSPIIVSARGNRIELTDASSGVAFDLNCDGDPERLGWTTAGSDDAFLALDRNGDGVLDDGSELFGNYTPQAPGPNPNGFRALAWHDDPVNVGNGDGVITAEDEVYSRLLLWFDSNHDGLSQPGELQPLSEARIVRLSLEYQEKRRRDRFGNEFRYIGNVFLDGPGNGLQRKFAIDVFLVSN